MFCFVQGASTVPDRRGLWSNPGCTGVVLLLLPEQVNTANGALAPLLP